jgi:hypothetical protein
MISHVNVESKTKVSETSSASGVESDHRIKFHETEVLSKTPGYMDRLVREATETKLHPDNINRREGFKLSKALNPSARL